MIDRCKDPDRRTQTPDEELKCIREIFSKVKGITDPYQKKIIIYRCIHCIKNIPKKSEFISAFRLCLDLTLQIDSPIERFSILSVLSKELPKTKDFENLYADITRYRVKTANEIENPKSRKDSLLTIVSDISGISYLKSLYMDSMEYALMAIRDISDTQHKIHAIMNLISNMPEAKEFNPLRLKAFKMALDTVGVPKRPLYEREHLNHIAKTLPKSCDVSFYRQYTLLGIAKKIPRTGEFLDLYRETINLAIAAAATIEEPYYRKYALCYIAEDLETTRELSHLYKHAIMEAFKAASIIADPIVKIHALIDILKILPKTSEFFPQFEHILKDILEFYSMRTKLRDFSPTEILDYILLVDEKIIKDSKKKRFTKEKYAQILARELERFGLLLNDIRFIEILKPYTHVWIKPKELRRTATKIVEHLENLQKKFHGKEIERPVFVEEFFPAYRSERLPGIKENELVKDCIAIDLGATNTVIMRRRWGAQPEFIVINSITRQYRDTPVIPTLLSLKTDTIGAAAYNEESTVSNFKKMLLEGNQEGKKYLEKYLSILYQHLKDEFKTSRWFSIFSGSLPEKLYMTVPIGFQEYKNSMKEIIKKTMRGVDAELLEEPLAAAIGYQIAEEKDRIIMIIDFGGSTIDIMIVRLNINDVHVIAKPDKSLRLGGRDLDIWLAEHLSSLLGRKGRTPSEGLLNIAEEIKIALSDSYKVPFKWNGIEVASIDRQDFEEVLDRHGFYTSIDRAISHVLWKAQRVGIKKDKIEAILLTGGSSQIPSFKDKIASLFPELHKQNEIHSHSPFTAVATGAAIYATRNISDKHLGLAYALKYKTGDEEKPWAYEIVFEKGESFPFEKTFRITPARTLGEQKEIYLELFEVPEHHIARRWERENGIEFIKQELKSTNNITLPPLRIISITFDEPITESVNITFSVNEKGNIRINYDKGKEIHTGIRLQ